MIILLTLLIGWLFTPLVKAQTHGECLRYRIVSYNVENLFDCLDDSLKADEEYLPEGMQRIQLFLRQKSRIRKKSQLYRSRQKI